MADTATVDVAIVGGGLVGASVALGLAGSRLRVALIEPVPLDARPPQWDERCIAINHASVRVLQGLGVWPQLVPQAAPILSTHVSERGRFGVARFSAAESGLDALGYNLSVRQLGEVLWQRAAQAPVQVVAPMRLTGARPGDDHVGLTLADGRRMTARLLVAADGAQSPVRGWMGVGAQTHDYRQSAIVTAVRCSRPHRGCAYERVTPEGPIALLPTPWAQEDRLCSLIWTTPSPLVADRMQTDDARFLSQAQEVFGGRLGRFEQLGRRQAHPLQRVVGSSLTAARTVFVGNAAQALHPVAAQGFNLGLRDAATLTELLATADDPGDAALLRAYGQRREADRRRMAGFTDGVVRLFSNRVPGLSGLRHLGLLALDLVPGLHETVLWQNLGYAGHSPQAAREP